MSETKFRDARGALAHSQKLVDLMRQSQQPQMAPEQPQEAPQQAPEQPTMPQETPQPQEQSQQPSPVTINVAPQESDKENKLIEVLKNGFENLSNFITGTSKKESKVDKELNTIKKQLKQVIEE